MGGGALQKVHLLSAAAAAAAALPETAPGDSKINTTDRQC